MMTLKESIEHCKDVALSCTNKECALEHFQLLKWLQEYSNILEKQGEKPKQEMNKGDETMLGEIMDFFEDGTVKLQHDLPLYASWLKSLKDRMTWKPSAEQMKALAWALSLAKNCGEECAFDLRTLQDQLKKLREE